MATFVFGDIHGCHLTQKALEQYAGITEADTLISVGDLVDRGPRIKETLDSWLNRPNSYIALGNHDFCFIDWFKPGGMDRNMFMVNQGLSDTLRQLGDQASTYAAELEAKSVYVIRVADQFVICHADYAWDDDNKFNYNHLWTRINPQTHATYNGPPIIHGHTPCKLSQVKEFTSEGKLFGINLDGGSVYGGTLRCMRIEDEEIFEISNID